MRGRSTGVLALVVAATLGVAACGGDEEKKGAEAGAEGKAGGIIKIAEPAQPDFLDPALSYTVDGWQALNLAYPGLVTFKREPGPASAEVVPGLAQDLPEVSEDGKTYTFKLREGLKFSDGKPLTATDFKASIERILEMDSQGAGLGFTNIVGGEDFLKTKKGGLDGIEADDATGEIVIKLEKPRGSFLYELAIPFGGVVPKDTPAKNQTKDPPPGAGRYTFEDVRVNRGFKMVKNPNFSEALNDTPIANGKPDGFDVTFAEAGNATTQIATNRVDAFTDNPAPDRVAELKSKYKERFEQFPTNSTFYFFMNSEVEPFDKLEVRQAVNHAIDPEAINRVQGGVLTPANTTLPPGVPGFEKSPDLYPYDLNKAKQLIKDAGAEGAEVTVWGNPENPTKPTVEYYTEVLNSIGLKAKTKIVPSETYFTTIGDRSAKTQTGWANWFQDYPHPANFIDTLVNPDRVVATGNNNYSYNAEDKELATKINALAAEPELTPEVNKRWAEVDREIQEKAYWAVYGNRKQTTFFSERLDFENCKGRHATYTQDWSQFCLK
ncbi:MAG: ABC transporter substrate-binding protein [Solirubrobacterales bacterium]|nr:ABC transporter substrate-binding protein [Solirubrobacterales bacterium]